MLAPTEPVTFALGKFAGEAEFVRMEGGEGLAALDRWVDEAMGVAHMKRGERWRTSFPMAAPYALLWHPWGSRDGDELLCGVIAPSRDAVGRDYPLAVVTRFSEALVAGVPHLVPLAFGDFLEVAYGAIDSARTHPMASAEFAARVHGIIGPTPLDITRAESEYTAWCLGTPVERAWGPVFPGQDSVAAADYTLGALGLALAQLRGPYAMRASLAMRLPLGAAGPAAAVLWLDVLRRLCPGYETTPSALWGTDDAALVVAFGAVPPALLTELWSPDPSSADVLDVVRMAQDGAPPSGLSAQRTATMQGWLEALGR